MEEFSDTNQTFRRRILEYILSNNLPVPDELLKDLLIAESKWAEQAWCVYMKYQIIAERLIKQSGTKYIDDFLESLFTCFDTYCACLNMDLSGVNLTDIVSNLEYKIAQATDTKSKKMYESGMELFNRVNPKRGLLHLQEK